MRTESYFYLKVGKYYIGKGSFGGIELVTSLDLANKYTVVDSEDSVAEQRAISEAKRLISKGVDAVVHKVEAVVTHVDKKFDIQEIDGRQVLVEVTEPNV